MGGSLPPALTSRLTKYLRATLQLIEERREAVSSWELGSYTGINPGQVRRDLSNIGSSGTRGVGYQTSELVRDVHNVLGIGQTHYLVLVGAGELGSAITMSPILPKRGFVVRDVFDNDPKKIGRTVGGVTVKHVDELKTSSSASAALIGIIATPASAAQEVADLLVEAGIKIILNYTDVLLRVPAGVDVHRVDPSVQLMHTLYYLAETNGEGQRVRAGFSKRSLGCRDKSGASCIVQEAGNAWRAGTSPKEREDLQPGKASPGGATWTE